MRKILTIGFLLASFHALAVEPVKLEQVRISKHSVRPSNGVPIVHDDTDRHYAGMNCFPRVGCVQYYKGGKEYKLSSTNAKIQRFLDENDFSHAATYDISGEITDGPYEGSHYYDGYDLNVTSIREYRD